MKFFLFLVTTFGLIYSVSADIETKFNVSEVIINKIINTNRDVMAYFQHGRSISEELLNKDDVFCEIGDGPQLTLNPQKLELARELEGDDSSLGDYRYIIFAAMIEVHSDDFMRLRGECYKKTSPLNFEEIIEALGSNITLK